tara:strand:+ start:381 stop:761 length:381 start_codon:yes stop_codon:yes gene_type:complete
MKLKKKTLAYKEGGKLKKKPKVKVTQKAGVTAEGETMPKLTRDPQTSSFVGNAKVEAEERTAGTKSANVKIAAVTTQLRALSTEDRQGAKGKALKNQLRILRDSKRGRAAAVPNTGMNAKGQVYNS